MTEPDAIIKEKQIDQFQQHGFTVVPNFFNARETAALQAEVERFQNQGLVRNVATEGDGQTPSQTKANLQLIPLFDKSDLIRALPFAPKVLDAVTKLIGAPFILHLDQMFLKPGGHGIGTAWHQDNAYFKIANPLKGTAMWIAIHSATAANGTLQIIPDSFKESYEHSRDPNSDHHIRCFPPEERAQLLALPAGGVAFFCYGTAHSTGPNTTAQARAGMAFHFLHLDMAKDARLLSGEQPRAILTGPQASGGQREYGVRVEGTWSDEVDRILTHTQS